MNHFPIFRQNLTNTLNTYILTQSLLIVKHVFHFNLIFFQVIRYNSDVEILGFYFANPYYKKT